MRRGYRLLWALILLAVMRGAWAQETLPHRAVRDGLLTIAWMPKSLDNPLYELGHEGCLQAAEELSALGKLKVECVYSGSTNADAAAQQLAMADMMARKIDSIAVSCVDATACVGPINAAMNSGIPVITWESDSPESMRLTHLGIDDYEAGRAAAELLVRAMGTRGDIAILGGNPASSNSAARVRGFTDALAQYPRIEIVELVNDTESIAESIADVEEVMSDNPRLDGWFFAGMWPFFGGIESMPQFEAGVRHSNMRAVAFDALPSSLQALQNDYLDGLIGQSYWDWGYRSVYLLYEHILNDKTFPKVTKMPFQVITDANVESVVAAWESYEFSAPLSVPFPPEDGTFTMAWIPKQLNNPVFELGRDSCAQAARELTTEYAPITVECLYVGTGEADMDAQAQIIADMVAQGVDAIAVSCNSDVGCVDPINDAVKAGIPVMTWDSDSPESQRFTYLGVDNYAAGRAAARQLIDLIGQSGEVIVLSGSASADNLNERVRGFTEYATERSQLTLLETLYCNDDPVLCAQMLESTLAEHPQTKGVFLVGLWPILLGREAIPLFVERAQQDVIRVVAFDTLPVELEWLQDGLLDTLIGQKYWEWGYESMQIMFNYVAKGQPYDAFIDIGFDLVNRASAAVMMDMWQRRDFSDDPVQPVQNLP